MKNERSVLGFILLSLVVVVGAVWVAAGPLLPLRESLVIAWALAVGTWLGVWMAISVRLNVPTATLIYIAVLYGSRLWRKLVKRWRSWRGKPTYKGLPIREQRIAHNVFDYRDMHRWKPYEVGLGYYRGKPIKVDITRMHWMIGGTTGAGKTNMIQFILCQLFLDPEFKDEVYIIDLKGDIEDFLRGWIPLAKKYVTDVGAAIELVHELVIEMNRRMESGWDRRVFLIFDEVATGTWAVDTEVRRVMRAELGALAIKARSAGIVILAATQHPRYDVLDKLITHNLRGKICLPVTHRSQAEVILAEQPPSNLPRLEGEFLVRDQSLSLRRGRSLLVDLPADINKIVTMRLVNYEDPRLEFFRRSCSHLPQGKGVPGVQKMKPGLEKDGLDWSIGWMQEARRNHALSGALIPPESRGQPYYLAKPYPEAVLDVASYIESGKWQEGPEVFVDLNGGNDG